MRRNKILAKNVWVFLLMVVIVSCKRYDDPPLVFEPEPAPNFSKDRKVLLISIDGLAGLELFKYVPQNISTLLENSKYTFEAIADANTHDGATWTTMLSGKNSAKHGVHTDDFSDDMEEDPDDPHGHNHSGISTGYISVYQRLLETGRPLKTLSITPWAPLDQNLFNLSDENGVVASDVAVKEKAVDRIKNGEDNLTFSVVNFRDLNTAGVEGGFSMDNAEYKATLDRIDGYIGEILEAIEERRRADNEDWMIVITSNHGGLGNSYGGASLEERKVPVIFYNPNFIEKQFETPELVNSLTVDKSGNDIPTMVDPNAYEIGSSGEFTILSKVYMVSASGTNSVIYGKTSHAYSSTRGWHLMTVGASKQFRYIIGDGSLAYIVSSEPFVLNRWYSVALKVYNENGRRYAKIYQDGVPVSSAVDITGRNMTAGTAHPFFIGAGLAGKQYGVSSAKVNNLAFYSTALSDEEISAYHCKQEISPTDEGYSDLTGYWKLGEGSGYLLKNSIETVSDTDFKFTAASLSWNLGAAWNCLSEEALKENILVNQYDILPQIFYWLNIEPDDSWDLEGNVFLNRYETEFVGK